MHGGTQSTFDRPSKNFRRGVSAVDDDDEPAVDRKRQVTFSTVTPVGTDSAKGAGRSSLLDPSKAVSATAENSKSGGGSVRSVEWVEVAGKTPPCCYSMEACGCRSHNRGGENKNSVSGSPPKTASPAEVMDTSGGRALKPGGAAPRIPSATPSRERDRKGRPFVNSLDEMCVVLKENQSRLEEAKRVIEQYPSDRRKTSASASGTRSCMRTRGSSVTSPWRSDDHPSNTRNYERLWTSSTGAVQRRSGTSRTASPFPQRDSSQQPRGEKLRVENPSRPVPRDQMSGQKLRRAESTSRITQRDAAPATQRPDTLRVETAARYYRRPTTPCLPSNRSAEMGNSQPNGFRRFDRASGTQLDSSRSPSDASDYLSPGTGYSRHSSLLRRRDASLLRRRMTSSVLEVDEAEKTRFRTAWEGALQELDRMLAEASCILPTQAKTQVLTSEGVDKKFIALRDCYLELFERYTNAQEQVLSLRGKMERLLNNDAVYTHLTDIEKKIEKLEVSISDADNQSASSEATGKGTEASSPI